jgi:NADH-quinone oxidoreductase subunit E
MSINKEELKTVFSPGMHEKIKAELSRYETKRSSILPILHALQDEYGWVQDKHIDALEGLYDLHRVHIKEVLTFYKAYRQQPPKKFEIEFCDNIVCCMMGAKEAMEKIERHIEKQGDNSPFAMKGVPCLGVCDQAPAMLVNKDRHHKVTADKVDGVLSKYASLS